MRFQHQGAPAADFSGTARKTLAFPGRHRSAESNEGHRGRGHAGPRSPVVVVGLDPSIAKALQLIKGGSSKWVHDTFPEHRLFGWQVKYGAFGISVSQLDKIIQYIKGQPEHHRRMTFQEEFLALLKKHRVEYDERYLWD